MSAWATAADLAKVYHVAAGTIYRWASEDRWQRQRTWPRRYALADAQASYDRRYPRVDGVTVANPVTSVEDLPSYSRHTYQQRQRP